MSNAFQGGFLDKLFLIAKCNRVSLAGNKPEFNFTGHYKGKKIRRVIIEKNDFRFVKGEEYAMLLALLSAETGVIVARLLRAKKVSEISLF